MINKQAAPQTKPWPTWPNCAN